MQNENIQALNVLYNWHTYIISVVFKNGPYSASFLFIFGLFQTNINTIFSENMSNQFSVMGFEPTASKTESPVITTRSGLLPY